MGMVLVLGDMLGVPLLALDVPSTGSGCPPHVPPMIVGFAQPVRRITQRRFGAFGGLIRG